MVNEAEANKSKDEESKKLITLKNDADQFIYNTEKQLTEHSARIPQNVKDDVRKDISSLNEAIVSENPENISESLERLKNSSMEIGKAIYSTENSDSGSTEGSEGDNQQQDQQQEEQSEEKKEEGEKSEEKKDEEKKWSFWGFSMLYFFRRQDSYLKRARVSEPTTYTHGPGVCWCLFTLAALS